MLAAMIYFDLNPIRADMAPRLKRSKHTKVRARHPAVLKRPNLVERPLLAMVGANSFNARVAAEVEYLFDLAVKFKQRTKREFFAQTNLEAPEESVTLGRIRIYYYLVFCVERIVLNHLIRLIDQRTVPKNSQLRKTSHAHQDNSNKLDTDHLLQYQ